MQHLESSASRSGAFGSAWFAGITPSGEASVYAAVMRESREADTTVGENYCDQLPTRELVSTVRRLLATQRRAEWLICRYLADLADRIRARQDAELDGYVDELHAARCFFQLGVRETRERVRIGRALRELPRLERAFIEGELSYSRVREVTRVATPETEGEWLSLAERLDMRALERRVAAAHECCGNGEHTDAPTDSATQRPDPPIRVEWTAPSTVRVTFELDAEGWALLERAIAGARHLATDSLTNGEAIEAVARDALSRQNEAADASDPRCSVVVYSCKQCGTSELDTGSGALELDAASADALVCSATSVDLAHEGRGATRGGALPAAVRRAVMLRDRCTCRVPGCNRRRYVDVHHLVPQASGGEHSRSNCVVLCTSHHRSLHEGKLVITGDAERCLDVRDSSGASIGPATDVATQGGAPATDAATQQGGTPAARLLQLMGSRGGWTMDALIEASGLPASTVSSTLLVLELGGSVRNREFRFERA